MCKGFATLPATCLKSAKDIKHRIGFLLHKPDVQHNEGTAKTGEWQTPVAKRIDPTEVKNWGESLENLVYHEVGLATFRTFLQTEYSEENLDFWVACDNYKNAVPREHLSNKAREIYDTFVEVKSPKEVNLDSATRQETKQNLEVINRDIFEEAKKKIFILMEKDSYRRFLKSKLYLGYLREPEKKTCGIVKRGKRNFTDLIETVSHW